MDNKQAQYLHQVLDKAVESKVLSPQDVEALREHLPERPKQKTLTEITHDVYRAWYETLSNHWKERKLGDLETWLKDLHEQLKGLEDEPANTPALPAGMRIAEHVNFGRVVVSPGVDIDGCHEIFYLDPGMSSGTDISEVEPDSLSFIDSEPAQPALPVNMRLADHKNFGRVVVATDWNNHHGEHFCVFFNNRHGCVEYSYLPADHLTFIDTEPAKPAHPEFLETEEDYQSAPTSTIVADADRHPWTKESLGWRHGSAVGAAALASPNLQGKRRVLRWGEGNE